MAEGPLVFAFLAGTVASANPCGFAILPAFFLSFVGAPEQARGAARHQVAQALLAGAAMTAAFVFVFGSVGGGLAAGASILMPAMPWATIAIGLLLLILGAAMVGGRHLAIPVPRRVAAWTPGAYGRPFLFGLAYAVASLSCTAPVFLAVVGASIGGNTALVRAGMFLAYAAGMGTVLTALALGAALARGGLHRGLRRVVPHVSRVSGVLLLLAGGYLIYYWTFFLLPGSERRDAGKGPIEALNSLAERLQTWLSTGAGAWVGRGLLAFVAILAGAVLVWRQRDRRRQTRAAEVGAEEPAGVQGK